MDKDEALAWATMPLKKYSDFTGRARRKEFWMYALLVLAVSLGLQMIEGILGIWGIFSGLFALAVLVPSIAAGARRLHDTGRSGWWQLIAFVPLIGALVLLLLFVLEGTPGKNQYGPDPLEGERGIRPGTV